MAVLGQQLTAPESGWKRYDNNYPHINYSGSNWTNSTPINRGLYKDTVSYVDYPSDDNFIRINFIGTSIRVISTSYSGNTDQFSIEVDRIETIISTKNNSNSLSGSILIYESIGLTDGLHVVLLKSKDGNRLSLDAIDVNETGEIVAGIGSQLTVPEAGWQRYDDKDSMFLYKGNWGVPAQASAYGGSYRTAGSPVTRDSHSVEFTFYGTKLRLFGVIFAQAPSQCFVEIDGTEYTFSEYGNTVYQALVFEKIGLNLGNHKVKVTSIATSGSFYFDAIDIDDNGYLVRQIGSQLTTPDAGWKRYDETSVKVGGTGWTRTTGASHWNGSILEKQTPTTDDVFTFRFYGTKIRVIDYKTASRGDRTIMIDGQSFVYNCTSASAVTQVMVFEKTDLPLDYHDVKISSSTGSWFSLDAVDIDSDGRLFHPDEVTNIIDLKIGKRIKCNYLATTSGKSGVFGNLGKETSSVASTPTNIPNVDFYFIMVDEYNGKKVLIADRNIQTAISWDALNSEGLIFGVNRDFGDNRFKFNLRLLTGGINASDKVNDWDKYIVSSTLDGKIIAGDNSVWNWSGLSTITSTSSASTTRVARGGSSISANSGSGLYRPVLEVEILPMNRSFINYEGSYRRFDVSTETWKTISATLPSEDTFINDGMGDLSILDRKKEDFVASMTANGSLGSGKIFKGSVDLKKYFEITSINVK
ncbi:MAG TPA: hypothetical protein DEF35_20815 [Paenibacillus sp.]|uniref:hypothetical protein n=1 Tax=Paenibacillus TaxID=44249 RepID=UPI000BA16C93|nr:MULTISPECIES: hypothetical protein [Paenibacillus]OZQ73111.1 hypothetical protein CA599_04525 [Paenibacillus taichungensis]HBU84060.1 hypothetical protein [Paenibacillus sp.]